MAEASYNDGMRECCKCAAHAHWHSMQAGKVYECEGGNDWESVLARWSTTREHKDVLEGNHDYFYKMACACCMAEEWGHHTQGGASQDQ